MEWKKVTHKEPLENVTVLLVDTYHRLEIGYREYDDNGNEMWFDNHSSYMDGDQEFTHYIDIPSMPNG